MLGWGCLIPAKPPVPVTRKAWKEGLRWRMAGNLRPRVQRMPVLSAVPPIRPPQPPLRTLLHWVSIVYALKDWVCCTNSALFPVLELRASCWTLLDGFLSNRWWFDDSVIAKGREKMLNSSFSPSTSSADIPLPSEHLPHYSPETTDRLSSISSYQGVDVHSNSCHFTRYPRADVTEGVAKGTQSVNKHMIGKTNAAASLNV